MKGLAGENLEAFEIDAVTFVELDIPFRKILADYADEFYRAEETRGNGGMAGGTAEETRVFGFGSFDGVERSGANDKNTHVVVTTVTVLKASQRRRKEWGWQGSDG